MFLPLGDDTPRLRVPFVTFAIVAACVAVYAWERTLGPGGLVELARAAGLVPWEASHLHDLVGDGHPRDFVPPPLTAFTSLFLHGDAFHLVGNMWFLWIFGGRLESYVGHGRFLAFYLFAGAVAAALQVVSGPDVTTPMIGASGAIAGALGAYARAFDRARVRTLVLVAFYVTMVELPAVALLGLWMLGQVISASDGARGVAFTAHIGGFFIGAALGRRLVVGRPPRARLVYHPRPWPAPSTSPATASS